MIFHRLYIYHVCFKSLWKLEMCYPISKQTHHVYLTSLLLLKPVHLYLIYCLFLPAPFLAIFHLSFLLSSPLSLSPFILPSLSLPSPDDSRTPALAQTWPTLTWNTRCAEEDEKVVEGGREENQGRLSIHFQYNQQRQNVTWKCHFIPIVPHYFLTGLIWSLSYAKRFWDI